MSAYSPGRPPNERDLVLLLNGSPSPLGILTSTGSAVNNTTTATTFNTGVQPDGTFLATSASLAGRVLLVSATAAGFLLPSSSAAMAAPNTVVATSSTIPPTGGTFPGVPVAASEAKSLIMLSQQGWLQWISSSGTASLIVWEML